MSTNQIGIVLTADGRLVQAELDRAGRALDNFGSQAQKSAGQAESGMKRINVSISEMAKAQIAATEAILADQKAKAQAAAQNGFLNGLREQIALYGKSTDEVARYRAAELGVASAAEPLLRQLASQRAAQEQAAQAAREEAVAQREAAQARAQSEASAKSFLAGLREQIALYGKNTEEVARYRAAQLGVAGAAEPLLQQLASQRAAQDQAAQAARGEAAAQREAAQARAQSEASAKSFLAGLREQVAIQGKSQTEILRYRAAQLGVGKDAETYIAQLEKAANATGQVGVSAKQTAAALRGIPAQFTDIVVSLASGQAPITVLLQQGGQLKDMFGGVGAAARAIGGYVMGLVNPYTMAAAAAGTLFLAYEQGRRESAMLEQSLLKTGNITGATTSQLSEMARVLDGQGFTRGAASAALAQIASTGSVATRDLQSFTKVAMDMERLVGTSIEDTAKAFKGLGDEPSKASLKLNESLHYLTVTQYEHIKALEEQSKKTEAARVAQQAYSDALKPILESAEKNLGSLERAWNAVGKGAKEAWDWMRGVGRDTLDDRLVTARKKLEDIQGKSSWRVTDEVRAIQATQAREEIRLLERSIQLEKDRAAEQAATQKQQEAGIKWSQKSDELLRGELKLKKEISEIEALGMAAGKDPAEIARLVALARQDYDKSIASANAEALISAAQGNAKRYGDYYKQELDAFRMSTADYLQKIQETEKHALQVERSAVAGEKTTTAADRIKQQSRLSELDAQIREVGEKYKRAVEDEDLKNQQVLERLNTAAGKVLDPLTQAGMAFSSQYGAIMRRAGADGNEAILEAGRAVWATMADKAQFETAKKQYDDLFAQINTQLEAVRQAADLDGGLFAHINAEKKAEEIKKELVPQLDEALDRMRQFKGTDLVNDKTVVEAKANLKKLTTSVDPYFKKMADGIETSLTDALMRGFESGKGFALNLRDTLVNMFKTLVLRPVIQAIVQPVSGTLLGSLGMSGTARAGTSVASTASGLSNLYSMGSNLYQGVGRIGAGAISSSGSAISTVGEWIGSSSMQAYGVGMQGATLAPGLAGPTTAGASGAMGSGASMAATYGPYANALGGALVGYMAGKMISGGYSVIGQSGNTAVVAGTAIGMAVGGPIGAAIGGAIGGVVNRAFGMGAKKLTSTGISGTFSDAGASVSGYSDWKQKGGWLRSDKSGTSYTAISSELDQYLDTALQGVTAANKAYASAIGLSATAVDGFSQKIKISLQGLDEAGKQKAISDAITKFGADMVSQAYGSSLEAFARQNETLADTLVRVAGNLTAVNQQFGTLGLKLYDASLAGADMAVQMTDLFGSLDAFKQSAASYYQDYYSEAERTAATTRQVGTAMAALGLKMPATRDGFRQLVKAQDLTTTSGRSTYAALLGLEGAFASVTKSSADLAAGLKSAIDATSQALAGLVDPLLSAIEQARSGITSAQDSITGTTAMTARQIQDAIASASISLPDASGVTSARTAADAAYQKVGQLDRLDAMESAYAPMYQTAARAFVDSMAASSWLSLQEKINLSVMSSVQPNGAAMTQEQLLQRQVGYLNGLNRYGANFNLATSDSVAASNYAGKFWMPGSQPYAQQVWSAFDYVNQTLRPLRDSLGSRSTAEADLSTAQAGLVSAQTAYSQAMRDYVADAGKAVEKLNTLREATVAYYQQQKALADTLLGSATKLRAAVDSVRLGQLDAASSLAQKQQAFDRYYSLALATRGTTQAGYADQMSTALPELATALKDMSASRSDWALSVAQLAAKSGSIAASLEAAAPVDYQAESLGLLNTIDGSLSAIQSATASAEKIISDAIYATSADNLTGLRAIVTQLGGTPAFASGGLHAGGLRLVGERGPELEVTGPSRIFDAGTTRRLLQPMPSPSGNQDTLLRELVDQNRQLAAELRALSLRVERMHADNNAGNAQIADAAKQGNRVLKKWDAIGIPAEQAV